jgi:hypothetical protein
MMLYTVIFEAKTIADWIFISFLMNLFHEKHISYEK